MKGRFNMSSGSIKTVECSEDKLLKCKLLKDTLRYPAGTEFFVHKDCFGNVNAIMDMYSHTRTEANRSNYLAPYFSAGLPWVSIISETTVIGQCPVCCNCVGWVITPVNRNCDYTLPMYAKCLYCGYEIPIKNGVEPVDTEQHNDEILASPEADHEDNSTR